MKTRDCKGKINVCVGLNIACVNMGMLKQRKIFLSYAFNISQFEWGLKMFMLPV